MATNKHALIRYRTLDRCFGNKARRFFIDDLLEECNKAIWEVDDKIEGIKKRQLYDDIRFMESEAGYSIELEKKKEGRYVYYRYTNPNFTIKEKGLNASETAQLNEALLLLSRFKGMPQFEWVEEMTARLESGLGLKEGSENLIDFEQNKYLKGIEHITTLFNASFYKKVVQVNYKPFKHEKEQVLILHPYFLKQYNNRWFCFGWNEELNKISNLALDRIIRIKEIKRNYKKLYHDYFEDYFEDIIGVTSIGDTQTVKIRFDSDLYPFIETKPLHGSQKIVEKKENYIVLKFELKLNYELESLILSFGDRVEVLEPEILRNIIKKKISNALKRY